MLDVSVISVMVADKINSALKENGLPPENRVVICVTKLEGKTASGIIIPESVEEGIAKKGVIVQVGDLSEDNLCYAPHLKPGIVAYYGDYAGKELSSLRAMDAVPTGSKLRVLSINEIMYLESNPNK